MSNELPQSTPQSKKNNVYTCKSKFYLGGVFTNNVSLAKLNCHRNFGKVFAFTHSNEKLKRKFVEESLLAYLSHILCCSVHANDDKSAKITRAKHICSCKVACFNANVVGFDFGQIF